MSDFTHYVEGQIADWMFQGTAVDAAPSNIYVGLHTSDPTDNPDGSTEVSTSSYSRYNSTAGTDWTEVQSGTPTEVENANEFQFPEATENWGTVSHVSLWDDTQGATGETAYATFALSSNKTIESGDTARFSAGDLSFQID